MDKRNFERLCKRFYLKDVEVTLADGSIITGNLITGNIYSEKYSESDWIVIQNNKHEFKNKGLQACIKLLDEPKNIKSIYETKLVWIK